MEDADADGYGDSSPPAGVTAGSDCNDGNAAVSPGDPEVCDAANIDEDCDGNADDYDTVVSTTTDSVGRYTDADLDGYGTGTIAYYCDPAASGLSATAGDCNDGNAAISPGDPEICDASNTDEDCDGTADDSDTGGATGKTTWYRDADTDTQGTSATTSSACDQPSGYVSNANDCNDSSAYIYQGAPELCDGLNNGCSGGVAASGWSAATSEDGKVSKVTSAGVWSNVSITGTSSAPTTVALDGSTYHVCEGTYYARMSVNANVTPTVQARAASGSTFVLSTGTAVGPTLTVDATTGRSSTRATLSGITIEGGSAGTGTSGSDLGAGIYVATATGTAAPAATHLTMTNVTIRDGIASYGGGLALVGMAGASGTNVTFSDNLAIERGGGVYASGTST
jgi:predicted outer membrane repeat protein